MLFRKFNFSDKATVEKFIIDPTKHETTIAHYYKCYNYTIAKLVAKCLQRNYEFNCRARPLLFLIRHSFELALKLNLSAKQLTIPNSHDFTELLKAFGTPSTVPADFIGLVNETILSGDGSSFRYYQDKHTGKPFFDLQDKFELARVFKSYNSIIATTEFELGNISTPFDYDGRKEIWEMTLHLGECTTLGQIRTQYDETIEMLVEGVLMEDFDIQLVYLPLLFLVRHSLELALKSNISEVQEFSELIKSKDMSDEHSLVTLYNVYNNYLKQLPTQRLPDKAAEQYQTYKPDYEALNSLIHNLDSNSRYFRYPMDKSGVPQSLNLHKRTITELLKLYYFTDPFITFTNAVLGEVGILN